MSGTTQVLRSTSQQITCVIKSIPEGNIIWMKDGNAVLSSLYTTNITSIVDGVVFKKSTLVLTNTQMSDQANYTCQAQNSIGVNNQHQFILVECKLCPYRESLLPYMAKSTPNTAVCRPVFSRISHKVTMIHCLIPLSASGCFSCHREA